MMVAGLTEAVKYESSLSQVRKALVADPSQGAIIFLVWSGLASAVFVWCSFWAYKFVDLDGESP